ncbi:MAG: energy-coupling factor transporter transmembrane protein EcfT [Desertifilum sp. SIO1I2]|nr:energy-coupling factor transporter transmembrane protein EcfT [Desertifilum sp. SIO1I2]
MLKGSIPFRLRLSLIFTIGTAFLPLGAWLWLGIYGAIALLWAFGLQVKARSLLSLLGAELLFLTLMALPLGWETASFLLARSLVCLLLVNSFLLTLPPHAFAIALSGLPLPQGLQESLLLTGQYLELLMKDVQQMQRSAACRGLTGTTSWLRYVSASTLGSLYIRTLDRAERVYSAMLARGYRGQLPVSVKSTPRETLCLAIAAIVSCGLTVASYLHPLT